MYLLLLLPYAVGPLDPGHGVKERKKYIYEQGWVTSVTQEVQMVTMPSSRRLEIPGMSQRPASLGGLHRMPNHITEARNGRVQTGNRYPDILEFEKPSSSKHQKSGSGQHQLCQPHYCQEGSSLPKAKKINKLFCHTDSRPKELKFYLI